MPSEAELPPDVFDDFDRKQHRHATEMEVNWQLAPELIPQIDQLDQLGTQEIEKRRIEQERPRSIHEFISRLIRRK